ncbi:MAG: hypothetical protein ACO1O6_10365 [Bacteroidota bacterium]
MKYLLFLLAFTSGSLGFSQTKQIAHKSHSGATNEFFSSDYTDNFGEPPEIIDSIIILKNKCIVEVFTFKFYGRDTFCDHPYFSQGYTEQQIRALYPAETKFVGFENYKPRKKHTKRSKKSSSHYRKHYYGDYKYYEHGKKPKSTKSSFHFLTILLALGAGTAYIFQPKKRK